MGYKDEQDRIFQEMDDRRRLAEEAEMAGWLSRKLDEARLTVEQFMTLYGLKCALEQDRGINLFKFLGLCADVRTGRAMVAVAVD